jgi:hypothetical protein
VTCADGSACSVQCTDDCTVTCAATAQCTLLCPGSPAPVAATGTQHCVS